MRLFTFWCGCKLFSRIYLLKCPKHPQEPIKKCETILPDGRIGEKQRIPECDDPEKWPVEA